MGKAKMVTASTVSLFLLISVLAGCGGGGGEASQAVKPQESKEPEKKPAAPIKLEIMTTDSGTRLPEGGTDYVKKKLDEKLVTDIQLTTFSSTDDYKNQLNIRMASANYPDMMQLDRIQMQEFARKGLLLDLTPYMDKMKAVQQFIGEDSLKKGTVNGKVYAIAKRPQIPYNNIWIRKDWLDKLNLKPPTTLDELMQVAIAFTEKDPDGNGKNDTYGLTGAKLSTFEPIFGAYGVGTPGSFYLKNSKLMSSFLDPGMKGALEYIKKLIDSGAVDPDILANTGNQHEKKAYQGKVGMIWTDFPKLTYDNYVKEFKAVNPNAEWIQIAPPLGPGGQFGGSYDIGKAPGMHGISKSVEKDPAKLNKIIEMLNYIAGNDGATLVAHGEEGRHWNRQDGKIVRTELRAKEHVWMYQLLGREEIEYLKSGYPVKDVDFTAATKRIETLNGYLDMPENYNSADAIRYHDEELAKFVYGKRPLSEYDAFVQTLETTFKYKTMIDSATKQLTDLNIVK